MEYDIQIKSKNEKAINNLKNTETQYKKKISVFDQMVRTWEASGNLEKRKIY